MTKVIYGELTSPAFARGLEPGEVIYLAGQRLRVAGSMQRTMAGLQRVALTLVDESGTVRRPGWMDINKQVSRVVGSRVGGNR